MSASQQMTAPAPAAPHAPAPLPRAKAARSRRFDLRRDAPRVAAVLGALVLVNLLVWGVLVRPKRAQIASLTEQARMANTTEKQARRQRDDLKEIYLKVTQDQREVQRFFGEVLSTKDQRMVSFQRTLSRVGKDFFVEPQRVQVGLQTLEDQGLERLAFSFPLTSGYENLRRFLQRLETMEQFVLVREVSLIGARDGGAALQLNVAVETYFNAPGLREELERERAAKLAKNRAARSTARQRSTRR